MSDLTFDVEDVSDSVIDLFSFEQRLLYDIVFNHFFDSFDGVLQPPFRLNVDNKGKTGKSYIIKMFFIYICRIAVVRGFFDPIFLVVRTALIDVAANAIQGTTLHSLLHLPIATGVFVPLQPNNASEFQNRLQALKYLVVDEKSIIGLHFLTNVDFRLR